MSKHRQKMTDCDIILQMLHNNLNYYTLSSLKTFFCVKFFMDVKPKTLNLFNVYIAQAICILIRSLA